MNPGYEVSLYVHELAADRLSPSEHIAAEVRYAQALERACAPTGGVLMTYLGSPAPRAMEEAPGAAGQPAATAWDAALARAEAETWRAHAMPAGAAFHVRVVADAGLGAVSAAVPF